MSCQPKVWLQKGVGAGMELLHWKKANNMNAISPRLIYQLLYWMSVTGKTDTDVYGVHMKWYTSLNKPITWWQVFYRGICDSPFGIRTYWIWVCLPSQCLCHHYHQFYLTILIYLYRLFEDFLWPVAVRVWKPKARKRYSSSFSSSSSFCLLLFLEKTISTILRDWHCMEPHLTTVETSSMKWLVLAFSLMSLNPLLLFPKINLYIPLPFLHWFSERIQAKTFSQNMLFL